MDPVVVKVLHDAFKKGMEEPPFLAALGPVDICRIHSGPPV